MRRTERGAATALVAIVAALVVGLSAMFVWLSAYVVAAHRARGVADLAALAAAHAYAAGGDACDIAVAVARANHGEVAQCAVSGPPTGFAVTLTAGMRVGVSVPGAPVVVTVQARAGTPAR